MYILLYELTITGWYIWKTTRHTNQCPRNLLLCTATQTGMPELYMLAKCMNGKHLLSSPCKDYSSLRKYGLVVDVVVTGSKKTITIRSPLQVWCS